MLPCQGAECTTGAAPYVETWFHQDYGSMSKPERTDYRAPSGALLSSTSLSMRGGEGEVG